MGREVKKILLALLFGHIWAIFSMFENYMYSLWPSLIKTSGLEIYTLGLPVKLFYLILASSRGTFLEGFTQSLWFRPFPYAFAIIVMYLAISSIGKIMSSSNKI